LHAGRLRGVGDVLRLLLLLLRGEVFPEIRHRVDAVRAGERFLQALDVVEIRLDDFGALGGKRLRFVAVRFARDGTQGEAARGIVQNRVGESATLRSGGADDGDDLLVSHGYFAPISLRTMAAPSASALSFILATMRASGFMPQSVLS